MKYFATTILAFFFSFCLFAQNKAMMIRIAEIEIDSAHLEEYKDDLLERAKQLMETPAGG